MRGIADLERIRGLRRQWFQSTRGFAEAVDNCFDRIGFTEAYVDGLIGDAASGKYARKSKVIKDNTWGMIEVDWQSVRLLDCPVVQRLRAVKQLGFSYLTYPSAEHSRFVHSLGMFSVVWRFLEAATRKTSDEDGLQPDGIKRYELLPRERVDLLHAAILHDIGHLPFSHAAEHPLKSDRRTFFCGPLLIDDFLFDVDKLLGKELQLSEALSLALILSPRFGRFYTAFVRPGSEDEDMTLRIAALVAGMRPTQQSRGVAQVISSSPVDADKIDYINRDALACGIPVGIDVARLFLRSNFYEVRADILRKLGIRDALGEEVVFIVNSSGVDTIDELAHSRAALYQRVYLHQTTRNAERLLSLSLESLPLSSDDAREPLRDALVLLSLDDAGLLTKLSGHSNEQVRATGQRIRTRQLPTRSCVFGRSLVAPLMPIGEILPGISPSEVTKQTLGMALGNLRSDVLHGEGVRELERKILDESVKLAALVRARDANLAPIAESPSIVTVLPMRELATLTKEAIVLENHELTYSSNRSISDEQNEAADLYKALGYVLTDRDWREIVCFAARVVFAATIVEPLRQMGLTKRSEQGTQSISVKCAGRLVLDQRAITRRASLKAERVDSLQTIASSAGYFDDVPWLVPAPEADFVLLAERLKKFSGQGGWSVGQASCASFIGQFPPGLRQEMTALLNRDLRIVDRDMIRTSLVSVIERLRGNYRTVHVAGLTPDSGNLVRTLLEHEARDHLLARGVSIDKDVVSALDATEESDLLLLCDDVLSSGAQAQCQFRSWFGVPREQWPLSHRSELGVTATALDDRHQERLTNANVALAICVGANEGVEELAQALAELGMQNFRGVYIGSELNRPQQKISAELTDFLRSVGADLMAYTRFDGKQSKDLRAEQRDLCTADSLGYRNAGGLLSTFLNVPTCTLTCIWCPGMARGSPWMPLLVRRGYLTRVVVA